MEKAQREKDRVLVVDSGDLFSKFSTDMDGEKALMKAKIIGRAYRRMGVEAVNVGCLDLMLGADFLRKEFSQGLPLISANLLDPSTQAPLLPPYTIKEVGGVRIAFFGLLPPESGPEISAAIHRANEGKILIGDPVEAAKAAVQKIAGKADLIVLLSDLGLSKDQLLAKAVPGIHFILGGHEGRFTRKGIQAGRTHIFQSSFKGMYVGHCSWFWKTHPTLQRRGRSPVPSTKDRRPRLHIRGLEQQEEATRKGSLNLDRSIQEITRQRNALQEELKRAKEAGSQGNRFLFKLEALEKNSSRE